MKTFDWDREYDSLIPFLCEHTGFSRINIMRLLDAQQAFWTVRADAILDEDDE